MTFVDESGGEWITVTQRRRCATEVPAKVHRFIRGNNIVAIDPLHDRRSFVPG